MVCLLCAWHRKSMDTALEYIQPASMMMGVLVPNCSVVAIPELNYLHVAQTIVPDGL